MSRKYNRIRKLIESTDGRNFSVQFVKRTTGEKRDMVCRLGVTKDVKGVGQSYVPKEKDLITVYEMRSDGDGGFKNIPLESIIKLKINGVEYLNTECQMFKVQMEVVFNAEDPTFSPEQLEEYVRKTFPKCVKCVVEEIAELSK